MKWCCAAIEQQVFNSVYNVNVDVDVNYVNFHVSMNVFAASRPDSILVRWQLAPINPSDVNSIQGTYAILPERLPAVPGGEGVGEVVHVGHQVQRQKWREI